MQKIITIIWLLSKTVVSNADSFELFNIYQNFNRIFKMNLPLIPIEIGFSRKVFLSFVVIVIFAFSTIIYKNCI